MPRHKHCEDNNLKSPSLKTGHLWGNLIIWNEEACTHIYLESLCFLYHPEFFRSKWSHSKFVQGFINYSQVVSCHMETRGDNIGIRQRNWIWVLSRIDSKIQPNIKSIIYSVLSHIVKLNCLNMVLLWIMNGKLLNSAI